MDIGASSYRRFLDGDDEGLTEIVENYKDGLILYINSYVGNIHTAEELAEDAFFRLITRKPGYSGRSSFKTWLYAIGRNVAVDYIRRNSRQRKLSDTQPGQDGEEQSMEQAYIREENKILVHRALSALSSDYRTILWLIYFEGFTNREAAKILRKSDRQIKNLLYRAKLSLRSQLEKEDFYDENL